MVSGYPQKVIEEKDGEGMMVTSQNFLYSEGSFGDTLDAGDFDNTIKATSDYEKRMIGYDLTTTRG